MRKSIRLLTWLPVVLAAAVVHPAIAQSQGATVTGRVTMKSTGQPLLGANVTIESMQISVGTNAQGQYSIVIPGGRVNGQTVVVKARSIGFAPMSSSLAVKAGASTVDFALNEDINRLTQVVVTGVTAGTEQRKLPFTVAQVSERDMPVPGNNPLNNIQGKIPGAQIVSSSGRPGSTPSIILRAPQSLNTNAAGRDQGPLLIVDGVIQQGSLNDVNPQDIESIEVVKGAAASTLYGSRAGNGVIQITTKTGKGQSEGIRFSTRVETGVSDIEGRYRAAQNHFLTMNETRDRFCIARSATFNAVAGVQDCLQTVDIYAEALRINEQAAEFTLKPVNFLTDGGIGLTPTKTMLRGLFQVNQWPTRFDPVSQLLTHGSYLNTNVDMTGKFGRSSFFASVGDNRQSGSVVFLDGYRRNNLRLNIDNTLGGNWTLSLRSFYAKIVNDNDKGTDFFRITRQPAFVDLLRRDKFGRLFYRSVATNLGGQNQNPAYNYEQDRDINENDRFQGAAALRWQPSAWFDGAFDFGFDHTNTQRRRQTNIGFRSNSTSSTTYLGSAARLNGFSQSYNASVSGTARRDLLKDLAARFTVRANYEQQDDNGDIQSGTNLAVAGLTTTSAVTKNQSIGSSESSQRAVGLIGSVNLEYRERYIADLSVRRDGLSVFGSAHRWQSYGRASAAWRTSEEKFWKPFAKTVNDLKLRYSIGQAGNRPGNTSQYETFTIGAGGVLNPDRLGNKNLRPEVATETEIGFDAEILHKYGLSVTHARNVTTDQILLVTPPAASGFTQQWKNAGTLEGNTLEISLSAPLVERRNFNWSARANYDKITSKITKLDIPTQYYSREAQFRYAVGENFGTMYGRRFVQFCNQLPSAFQSRCGDGKEWQKNSDGLIVWTGGQSLREGITRNLWGAQLAGANAPWGADESWGMPIVRRVDASLSNPKDPDLLETGRALPDFRWSASQTLTFKRFSAYMLFEAVHGKSVYNEERAWSFGDFQTKEEDQGGKSVADAKPLGYYWRSGPPASGVGGIYDVLGSNMYTTEDASYLKLREVSVGYRFGKVAGVGDWTLSFIGRNLKTWTPYKGFDPEVGLVGGNNGSAVLNAVDGFSFPNFRTLTVTLSSSF